MRPVHLTKFTARMSIFFFFDGFGFACATTVATVPIACCSFFRLAEAGAVLADSSLCGAVLLAEAPIAAERPDDDDGRMSRDDHA